MITGMIDLTKCTECENAKPKDTFHDKKGKVHQMWFCGKHKTYVTEFTLVKIGCGGKDFKKRGIK